MLQNRRSQRHDVKRAICFIHDLVKLDISIKRLTSRQERVEAALFLENMMRSLTTAPLAFAFAAFAAVRDCARIALTKTTAKTKTAKTV
jgi:hypothetical protein